MTFDPAELAEVLAKLEDVGQLVRAQRNTGYPLYLIINSPRPFDGIDALAADICSAVKRRGEQFDDEDQLRSYLDEDGVRYDPQSLASALRQLEELGRIKRPIVEHSWANEPLPGTYVPPRINNGP